MSEQAPSSKIIELKPELSDQTAPLKAFFGKLKTIRNLSLGVGALGTGALIGSAYKPIGVVGTTVAVTVTTLALSTAATAQVLLSLNEQLEIALNQPGRKPDPGSFGHN